jgi:hypothetical protein
MNRSIALLAQGVLFFLLIAAPAGAAPSKDETNLAREAAELDRTASTAPGEAAVVKQLHKDFAVEAELVQALRERGFGYGELTIILSLAAKMAGGVSDQNAGKVLALREGPPVSGWSTVAKRLGIKLGVAVSQVRKVNNGALREMKKEQGALLAPRSGEPAPPSGERKKTFTGEGKDMTRGRDAD